MNEKVVVTGGDYSLSLPSGWQQVHIPGIETSADVSELIEDAELVDSYVAGVADFVGFGPVMLAVQQGEATDGVVAAATFGTFGTALGYVRSTTEQRVGPIVDSEWRIEEVTAAAGSGSFLFFDSSSSGNLAEGGVSAVVLEVGSAPTYLALSMIGLSAEQAREVIESTEVTLD